MIPDSAHFSRSSALLISAFLRLALLLPTAASWLPTVSLATTRTWDGSNGGSWANGANWSGGTAPVAGDDLVFPTGVAQLVSTNDFSPNRTFGSLTILGANYVLRGNPLVLTNGLRCGNSSAANAIDAAITVAGTQAFVVTNGAASLLLRGTNLSLGVFGLTLSGSGRMDISNAITGSSGIIKSGANTVLFFGAAANTYLGATFVTEGILKLSKTNVTAIGGELIVGDGTGGSDVDVVQVLRSGQFNTNAALKVNSSGWFDCSPLPAGQSAAIGNVTLDAGGHITGPSGSSLLVGSTLTASGFGPSQIDGAGYLFLTGPSATINIADDLGFSGLDISIPLELNGLTKTGPGTLRLLGSVIGSPDITINAGTLQTSRPDALGAAGNSVTVASGGTLLLNGGPVFLQSLALNGSGVGGTQGALRVAASGSNVVWGGNITLNSDATVFISGSSAFDTTLTVTGAVSGLGRLIKDGKSMLRFAGTNANTYSGGTTIRDGYLDLQKTPGVPAIPGNIIIGTGLAGSSPDLHLSAANQIADTADVSITNGMFDLNTFSETIGTLNGGGNVTSGAGGALIVSPSGVTCTYGGIMSSLLSLQKSGSGKLILTGNNTYTGSTAINNGTLQVDGTQQSSDLSLASTGRLTGSGTVGDISTKFGTIAPGASPGILTCSNLNFILSQGVTNVFELNGPAPGTGYDQINVRGTVTLNNAILSATLGFASSLSNQFVIVNNDGADAVSGIFNGLPQNATLTIGGEQFRISYTGGDGNDVVLTQITGGLPSPRLTIEFLAPDKVRLLWPTNHAAGFNLQSNTNVNTTNWVAVSPAPVVVGSNNVVTNSVTAQRNFYRLLKP